jgi:hypothetical protein
MSFQHFSRQARGDPSRTQEEQVPIWKKEHVVYSGGDIPIYWCPNKEIPPLPCVLSFLLSVTKTEGKAKKAFQVMVTLLAWP